jgi:sugar lactone lactonase YvrE
MLNDLATRGSAPWRQPRPLLLERLENRLCRSTRRQHLTKRHLLILSLVAILTVASDSRAYADLYVISARTDSVLRYNEVTGAFIDVFISADGGLKEPNGLLFGPDGNLYVTSPGTKTVMRYDGTTGAPLPAPGQSGATFIHTVLEHADQLILGPDGNLYVAGFSDNDNNVLRYDGTTGAFIDNFIPPRTGGLSGAGGLLFGPDGNLFVCSTSTNEVMRYDGTTGAPLPAPGQRGAVFASHRGFGNPGLIFGPDGNLYVSDYGNGSVVRFNGATGEFIDVFVSPGSGGLSGAGPMLLFGPDNNLYVGSESTDSVLRYDGTTGAFIDVFISAGSGGLHLPHGQFFTHTDPTTLAYVPPPVNRFQVTAAPTAVSGTPFDITVTALDPSGNIDTSYQGTVTFSTTDPDSGVVLPADYTFTIGVGSDNGVHIFTSGVSLVTLGDQKLTVTDTVSSFTGSVTITVGPGP